MERTEEEEKILKDRRKVEKGLYTDEKDFVIQREKFLSPEKMIMVRKHTRFVDFPNHKHNYIEINYVYSGQLKQTIGEEKITLQQGDLLFLNQHIEHEIEACGNEDLVINFIIHPQFFDDVLMYLSSETIENKIGDFFISSLFNQTQAGQYLHFVVDEIQSIQEWVHKIIQEIMQPTVLSESTIKLYMGLLMIELIKHSDKVKSQRQQYIDYQFVMESLTYIEQNYQNASLYDLADKLNQPHYSLSKAIKQATKHTFKELLQDKRLNKSKELLHHSNLPIASIIEEVGYSNISYFYRIFKRKYGYTPKNLRRSYNKS